MQLRSHHGYTLTELLLALMIGTFLLGGLLGGYVQTVRHQTGRLGELELQQSLVVMLDQVESEMRRSGYMANAAIRWQAGLGLARSYPWNSAIRRSHTDLLWQPELDLGRLTVSAPAYDCILLRYDADANGTLGEGEIFGYRYHAINKAVERKQWSTLASQRQQGCEDGDWQDLTSDGLLQISRWQLEQEGAPWLWRLTMAGYMANRPELELQMSRLVRLRNAP